MSETNKPRILYVDDYPDNLELFRINLQKYYEIYCAGSIKEAIEMPKAERQRRMKAMRETVASNNIYRWGASTVSRLISMARV